MPKQNRKSTVVALRIPNEIYEVIRRRVDYGRGPAETVSEYLRDIIIYAVGRKHERRNEVPDIC